MKSDESRAEAPVAGTHAARVRPPSRCLWAGASLLLTLSPIAALAQAHGQNGIRIGGFQTVFFLDPAPVAPVQPTPRADFETWVEGLDREYAESVITGSDVERHPGKLVIQRYLRDNFRRLDIRYSVILETLPETGTYRATFGVSNAERPKGLNSDWQLLAPPRYPAPQIAKDGDTIPLKLYLSPASGHELMEYIHLGQLPPALRTESPRDVYTDAPEFDISLPRLRMNGVAQELSVPSESFHGPALWIYIPGQGRFDLSFKPASNFELCGEAFANSLIFSSGEDLFRLDGAERIAAAGSAPYRIYARKDAAWLPPESDRSHALIGVTGLP
jgi:hypothetical protein